MDSDSKRQIIVKELGVSDYINLFRGVWCIYIRGVMFVSHEG